MANVIDGKIAIVTGAGSGIGQGAAMALASAGAKVLCVDLNEGAANATASSCGGAASALDLAADDAEDAIVAAAHAAFGPVDILVQSAGVAVQKPFLNTTAADYDFCYSVNQRGLALAARTTAADMIASGAAKRGGGRIINIASVSGRRGSVDRAAYGSTKAAVINLTQVMATELGPLGSRRIVSHPAPSTPRWSKQPTLLPAAPHGTKPCRWVATVQWMKSLQPSCSLHPLHPATSMGFAWTSMAAMPGLVFNMLANRKF